VCDFTAAFKAGGTSKQAAIKKFLDFAYQDRYQLQFDKEYDLLPATTSAANALSSDPIFGPFLKNLPNAVQYPNATVWANVKTQIQHTIGTAVSSDPSSVLDAIQQTAQKGS
jgi:multiple sugar transport system substrate-binding protein